MYDVPEGPRLSLNALVQEYFLINVYNDHTLAYVLPGELQLVCGRPTLALSSVLVPQTLSYSVCMEDS